MKKIMLTTLIASMLLLPLGSTALADYEEAPAPAVSQDYLPGDMPAGTSPAAVNSTRPSMSTESA